MGNDFDAVRACQRRIAALAIVTLVSVAGLGLGAAPAHAQYCGDPKAIAQDLLDSYTEQLADYFTLTEKACDSMSDAFLKACTGALKDAVKCGTHQIESIEKAAEPACEETARNLAACIDDFDDAATAAQASLEAEAEAANADCESAAATLFATCSVSP